MKQFNIYKSMMKYLTDKNLSLNAKGLLSIVLFQDEIIGTEIENYIENVNTEYRNIKELSSSLNSLSQIIKEDKEDVYAEVVDDMYSNKIISERTFDRITDWDNEYNKVKDDFEL